MTTILAIHSIIRWLIVALAAIAAIRCFVCWRGGRELDAKDRGLLTGFSGLMDLQVLIGLVYFFGNGLGGGGFPPYRMEHAVIMLASAFIVHLPARWKRLEGRKYSGRTLLAVLGSLAIVLLGVARLPGGWTR